MNLQQTNSDHSGNSWRIPHALGKSRLGDRLQWEKTKAVAATSVRVS